MRGLAAEGAATPRAQRRRRDGGGSRDDLRRDSEGGGGAASEGEFEKPFDGEPPPPREALWREKRGLLRKTPGAEKRASPSFTRTGHERLEPRNGPRARRRSFDGDRDTVARGEGKKKTHHRADSEPVPGYVPPRLEREPAERGFDVFGERSG